MCTFYSARGLIYSESYVMYSKSEAFQYCSNTGPCVIVPSVLKTFLFLVGRRLLLLMLARLGLGADRDVILLSAFL